MKWLKSLVLTERQSPIPVVVPPADSPVTPYDPAYEGGFYQVANAQQKASELAAVEASASMIARAFALAVVEPAIPALTPAVLALMGRSFVLRGESLWAIDVDPMAGLTLTPSSYWDVYGGPRETAWRYRMDMQGPSRVSTIRRPYASVVHPRINVHAARPWQGRSPIAAAGLSASLAARVEQSLQSDAKIPATRFIPWPYPADGEKYLGQVQKGGLVIAPTQDPLTGHDARPSSQMQPQAMGPDPADSLVALRKQLSAEVMGACGVPMELVMGDSEGSAAREALRRFLHLTLQPWAEVLAAELSVKLDQPVTLNFDRIFAADLSGRARAFQSLVKGGMAIAQAAALAGLVEED